MGLQKHLVQEQSHPVPLSVPFALCYVSGIEIPEIQAENPSVLPVCSEHWSFTSLQHCHVICLGTALVWSKITKTNKRPGFWFFYEIFLYHLYFSSLWTERMKSTHTVTHTSIFLCAGNWSCLMITTDLIRAGLLIHSSAKYLWGLFPKINCASTWTFYFNQSRANAVWK